MLRNAILIVIGIALVSLVFGCPRKPATPPGGIQTPPPVNTNQTTPPATPEATTTPDATSTTPPDGTTPDGTTTDAAATPGATTTPPTTEPPTTTPPAAETPKDKAVPSAVTVVFETTKGNFEIELHKEWSPLGVAHFIDLVNGKFYDGAPWFRVIDGFVAQCGVAADPKLNEQWMEQTIDDEPLVQGNQEGFVAFGKSSMPNSRSTHIFVNLVDNTRMLDPQGFSCFAKVTKGMDVVKKLEKVEFGDQQGLASPGGMDTFKKMYPKADYIKKAYIKK